LTYCLLYLTRKGQSCRLEITERAIEKLCVQLSKELGCH